MKPLRVVNWARFLGVPALFLLLLVWCVFACAAFLVDEPAKCWTFYALVGAGGLICHAGYRAHRQNPATNWRYSEWLRLTPWEWDRPLPLGHARLSLADGLLVLLFAVLFPWGWWHGLLIGVAAFACGYLLVTVQCAIIHKEPFLGYGSALLLGLGIALSAGPHGPTLTPLFVALLGVLLLSQLSLPRILGRFDELTVSRSTPLSAAERKQRRRESASCGSPWNNLLWDPQADSTEPSSVDSLMSWMRYLAVAAWLLGCTEIARQRFGAWAASLDPVTIYEDTTLWGGMRAASHEFFTASGDREIAIDNATAVTGVFIGGVVLGLFILGYLGVMISGKWPPISLAGRIATGRWIIPGYDYIFVAPLASLTIYSLISLVLCALGQLGILTGGIAFLAAVLSLVRLSPDLESWRLTGHHRIVCSSPPATRK